MNLLDGGFIRACSAESQTLQQLMKIGQTEKIDGRRAQSHRCASDRIKHPASDDNRHARFSLDNGDLSSRSPFSVKLPDLAAIQRVPSVVDDNFSVDMGRMAPQLLWDENRGCSAARTAVVSVLQPCTALSSRPK